MTLAAHVYYVCAAITDQSSATRFRSATLEFTTQHALSGLGWRTHIQPMLLDELQVNHNEAHPALMRMRGQGVFYLSASLPGYVNHAWRGLNVETTFSLRSVSASPIFAGCRRLLQVTLAFNRFLLMWLILHRLCHFLSLHLRTRFSPPKVF
jgi:hypothetical protein